MEKNSNRKNIPAKIQRLLQKEIDSKCPFCPNEEVAHFVIHHIDGNRTNDSYENLILVCRICHSKIHNDEIAYSKVKEIKYGLTKTEKKLTALDIAELENEKIERKNKRIEYLNSSQALDNASEEFRNLIEFLETSSNKIKEKNKNIPIESSKKGDRDIKIIASRVYILIEWYRSYDIYNSSLTCSFNENWAGSRGYKGEQKFKYNILRFKFDVDERNDKGWKEQYGDFYTTDKLADYMLRELMKEDKS